MLGVMDITSGIVNLLKINDINFIDKIKLNKFKKSNKYAQF